MNNRFVIHVDMNSFFATAEQQANPSLRGHPIIVRGSKSERTIVVASSIEAKRLGIKTGQLIHEAKKIYPEIKIVTGEPKKYSYILKILISIFERYSDKVEIFSIDECFLDVTNTAHLFVDKITEKSEYKNPKPRRTKNTNILKLNSNFKSQISNWHGSINIANFIKSDIRAEVGEWMTCSVGVAKNKFLAKLASDIKKPDGLVIIVPNPKSETLNSKQAQGLSNKNIYYYDFSKSLQSNKSHHKHRPKILTIDEALLSSDLSDFCGIGKNIKKRLLKNGVKTVKELREAPDWKLKKEFGLYGFKMKNWSFGIDNTPIIHHKNQKEAKSFSKARTLDRDVFSKEELKKTLYLLSETLGIRMRKEGYWGNNIGLWVRYSSFSSIAKNKQIGKWICDGYEIFKYSENILEEVDINGAVRAIGVSVSGVQPKKNIPVAMFESEKTEESIIDTIDFVNKKYGDFSLMRASVCNMKLKEVTSGIGRKNKKLL